ncbi:MAG TPA: hypothetical protein VF832_00535, partial [Longimicrobiales bacterium]
PAAAQQPTTRPRPDTTRAPRDTTAPAAVRDTAAPDTTGPRLRVSPGKAFYRSLIIPGWGQASAGNYKRAAVWVFLQGASDAMLGVTLHRLSSAEKVWNANVADTTAKLLALPDSVLRVKSPADTLLRTTPALWHLRNDTLIDGWTLVRSRRKQREDRIFQALFFTLVGGLDAFINAQLSDFPAGVGVEPKGNGRYQVTVDVPWPLRKVRR